MINVYQLFELHGTALYNYIAFSFFVNAVQMSELKTWVSDKLMSLLGYSQPTVVQYVITLCKLVFNEARKSFGFPNAKKLQAISTG